MSLFGKSNIGLSRIKNLETIVNGHLEQKSSLTEEGHVQLNDTVDSPSVTQAPTANAVKLVNDSLSMHKEDLLIHVTQAEKDRWNANDTVGVVDEEPIAINLNRGTQIVNATYDSTAKVTLLEGQTYVNHAPLLDSDTWINTQANLSVKGTMVVESPNSVVLEDTINSGLGATSDFITIKLDAPYTLSADYERITGSENTFLMEVICYDSSKVLINEAGLLDGISHVPTYNGYALYNFTVNRKEATFTVKDSRVAFIRVKVGIYDITRTSKARVKNVMLNEGATALPFVANVQGLTNPTITNATTGDSLTFLTTLHTGESIYLDEHQQPVKDVKEKEIIFDNNILWAFGADYTGFKGVKFNISTIIGIGSIIGTGSGAQLTCVKYNGKLVTPTGQAMNGFDLTVYTGTELYVTISDTDSGWGETYTPTADEVKAYFLGWKMYDTYTGSSPYNRTDGSNKGWLPIIGYTIGSGEAITNGNVPKTQAPRWQPYRLIYDLATPKTEAVAHIGSLSLAKGDNTIEVTEGRIVRERAKVIQDTASTTNYYININSNVYTSVKGSELKNKAKQILKIYKNGKDDTSKWAIAGNANSYGSAHANIKQSDFDPTAIYEIDYIPLEPYKLTVPINNVGIEYQSNLGSVVAQLVEDVADSSYNDSIQDMQILSMLARLKAGGL